MHSRRTRVFQLWCTYYTVRHYFFFFPSHRQEPWEESMSVILLCLSEQNASLEIESFFFYSIVQRAWIPIFFQLCVPAIWNLLNARMTQATRLGFLATSRMTVVSQKLQRTITKQLQQVQKPYLCSVYSQNEPSQNFSKNEIVNKIIIQVSILHKLTLLTNYIYIKHSCG